MQRMIRLVTTTALGGILFLLPAVLTVLVVAQALKLALRVLAPIEAMIPAESFAGVTLATVVAGALLLAVCFGAGLVARTRAGTRVNEQLEGLILKRIPGFALLKSAAEGVVGLESGSGVTAALAYIEECWVPAFVMERHTSGLFTVFVPSVPTPAAGAVYLLEETRVRPLDVPVTSMVSCIMRLGLGLRELIEPAAPPHGALNSSVV